MRFWLLVGVVSVLTGCRTESLLVPRLILQGEPVGNEFWLAAPYIAVVRIIHADRKGSPTAPFPGGPDSLQLVKFEAEVENQIKGDLGAKTIAFFFFANLERSPSYYLDPGKRFIVSLRREGNVLRSWADATQLRIEILSGAHKQSDLPLDRGPGATIAYLLLTPGTNFDVATFSSLLGPPADSYADPLYVKELLEKLQRHSNRTIRESACLTAASMFWYRPQCLGEVAKSPLPAASKAAVGFLTHDDADLPTRLRDNPFFLFPKQWTDHMAQWLEIFAEDSRPDVRKQACRSLRNFAPQQVVESCKSL